MRLGASEVLNPALGGNTISTTTLLGKENVCCGGMEKALQIIGARELMGWTILQELFKCLCYFNGI